MVSSTAARRTFVSAWLLVLAPSFGAMAAAAQPPDQHDDAASAPLPEDHDAPDPASWLAQIGKPSVAYIQRVVVVASPMDAAKSVEFPQIDQAAMARLSFLDFVASADAGWTDKINHRRGWAGHGLATRVKALLAANEAQALVSLPLADGDGDLTIGQPGKDETLTTLARSPRPKPGVKGLALGLRRLLGYDAVVLAQAGAYVLARSPDLANAGMLFYAVSLADSESTDIVSAGSAAALPTAFLRLAKSKGQYSVWRVVSSTLNGSVPAGTKLVLETRPRQVLKVR